MPEKKTSVISQLLCVFQKKKPPCDDIVTAAEKVIEEYIFCKNKLIRNSCKTNTRENTVVLVLFGLVAVSVISLYLILSS